MGGESDSGKERRGAAHYVKEQDFPKQCGDMTVAEKGGRVQPKGAAAETNTPFA